MLQKIRKCGQSVCAVCFKSMKNKGLRKRDWARLRERKPEQAQGRKAGSRYKR